jgi:hypothetical protein
MEPYIALTVILGVIIVMQLILSRSKDGDLAQAKQDHHDEVKELRSRHTAELQARRLAHSLEIKDVTLKCKNATKKATQLLEDQRNACVAVITNKSPKSAANKKYIRLDVLSGNLSGSYLFTHHEFSNPKDRAAKNPEDIK